MNNAPFLRWYENLALWVLWRSPRLGMVATRSYGSGTMWYYQNPREHQAWWLSEDMLDEDLPVSFELERMYHMPSYGDQE